MWPSQAFAVPPALCHSGPPCTSGTAAHLPTLLSALGEWAGCAHSDTPRSLGHPSHNAELHCAATGFMGLAAEHCGYHNLPTHAQGWTCPKRSNTSLAIVLYISWNPTCPAVYHCRFHCFGHQIESRRGRHALQTCMTGRRRHSLQPQFGLWLPNHQPPWPGCQGR